MLPARRALIVVSCGAAKTDGSARPRELYTGAYTRLALAAADRLVASCAGAAAVRILSARHGLLDPDGPAVSPYDDTLPSGGAAPAVWVSFWAHPSHRGSVAELLDAGQVLVLAGRRYHAAVAAVRADAARPVALETSRGIGDQLSCFARLRDSRDPWSLVDLPAPTRDV